MAKCSHCNTTKNLKKIAVPIERRGKIVGTRKTIVCPHCLSLFYPEFMIVNKRGEPEPERYEVNIRGKTTTMRGRNT